MAWFNIRKERSVSVQTENKSKAEGQVINDAAAEYLSRKSGRVDRGNRAEYNQIVTALKDGKRNMSDPKVQADLTRCLGGQAQAQDKAVRLESLHKVAAIRQEAVGIKEKLSAKTEQIQEMAAELVDYAGSSNTEKKKLVKEKVARGDSNPKDLTQAEKEEVTRRHEAGIKDLAKKYMVARGEVAELEAKQQGMRNDISSLRENVGEKAEGVKKLKDRVRDSSPLRRKSTASSLDSILDNMDSSLQTRFDKYTDYNVQSQMADVTSDKLDLFCYPQYNISSRSAAAIASVDDKDMMHDLACLAFESATSVLENEVGELINGIPPMPEAELKQRFGSFDLNNDPDMKDKYESAKAGAAAAVSTPEELQTLYGNLLVLESEMNSFDKNVHDAGSNIINHDDPNVDLRQGYLNALAGAKENLQAKAQEMGVALVEERTPTLSDEIESRSHHDVRDVNLSEIHLEGADVHCASVKDGAHVSSTAHEDAELSHGSSEGRGH